MNVRIRPSYSASLMPRCRDAHGRSVGSRMQADFHYGLLAGAYPRQNLTGNTGYRGNAGSFADSEQR
jgi:hypothetical protein